jgi:hypothetical protein
VARQDIFAGDDEDAPAPAHRLPAAAAEPEGDVKPAQFQAAATALEAGPHGPHGLA